MTDTFGRILKCHVCAADTGERTGGRALLHSIKARWVKLKAAFVDGGYSGVDFKAEIKTSTGITLEHVATPNAYRDFARVSGFPPQLGEFEQAIKEWRAGHRALWCKPSGGWRTGPMGCRFVQDSGAHKCLDVGSG